MGRYIHIVREREVHRKGNRMVQSHIQLWCQDMARNYNNVRRVFVADIQTGCASLNTDSNQRFFLITHAHDFLRHCVHRRIAPCTSMFYRSLCKRYVV